MIVNNKYKTKTKIKRCKNKKRSNSIDRITTKRLSIDNARGVQFIAFELVSNQIILINKTKNVIKIELEIKKLKKR